MGLICCAWAGVRMAADSFDAVAERLPLRLALILCVVAQGRHELGTGFFVFVEGDETVAVGLGPLGVGGRGEFFEFAALVGGDAQFGGVGGLVEDSADALGQVAVFPFLLVEGEVAEGVMHFAIESADVHVRITGFDEPVFVSAFVDAVGEVGFGGDFGDFTLESAVGGGWATRDARAPGRGAIVWMALGGLAGR